MNRWLTKLIPCGVLLLWNASRVEGGVILDTFDTSHNYAGGNVASTVWDGVLNFGNLSVGNANTSNSGRLTWESTSNSGWEASSFANAPTLYKLVSGDFDVSVEVTNMTTSTFSDGGLIVRVPSIVDAGSGEDYLALRYFRPFGINGTRNTDNGSSANFNYSGPLQSLLRITRSGNQFDFFTRATVTDPWGLRDTVVRSDLTSISDLQVGLWFGTFSSNAGQVQFDNFSLSGPNVAVPEPSSVVMFGSIFLICFLLRLRRDYAPPSVV